MEGVRAKIGNSGSRMSNPIIPRATGNIHLCKYISDTDTQTIIDSQSTYFLVPIINASWRYVKGYLASSSHVHGIFEHFHSMMWKECAWIIPRSKSPSRVARQKSISFIRRARRLVGGRFVSSERVLSSTEESWRWDDHSRR
jgi:hypothetical protein